MLSTAIILPGEEETFPFDSLRTISGVEWDGIFYSGKRQHPSFDRSLIFSSPEIIPLICDLLIVIDPLFCTFDYLSFAIRNGCHLFLSDKLKLTTDERKQLVLLANEGGTYIQIQNDFLFHPFQKKIRNNSNQTTFIEAFQTAPEKYDQMDELLSNNLLMILRAAGSMVHKVDVFRCANQLQNPDVLKIHITFKNGSDAELTLKFNESDEVHLLSVDAAGEVTIFDFVRNKISHLPKNELRKILKGVSSNPLQLQISEFIENIAQKNNPGYSLSDEMVVFLLMDTIREKLKTTSQSPSIHQHNQ